MTETVTERLEGLYQSEFGEPIELALRQGIVVVVSALMITLTQDVFFVVWAAMYYLTVLVFWWTVRPGEPGAHASAARLNLARALYVLSISTFYLGPIYTMSLGDPIYMLVGAYALVGTALFLIQRPDPAPDAVWLDSASFAIGTFGSFLSVLPMLTGLAQQMVAGAVCLATLLYFMKASQARTARHKARRDAERRYAGAMKSRALGQFVGGVAHDFNNLLTAIIGNLELHDLLDDPTEKSAALRQSREAAQRAAMTVKQLLASSGRTRLNTSPTELGGFVLRLEPVLRDLLESGISVQVSGFDDPIYVHVDREMLETCVIQLCLNAQDALGRKGSINVKAVTLATRPDLDPPLGTAPPYPAILVEDDGPGVSAEALGKLAEPFYTTKPVGEGVGLGLSAVAGFARQSGGGLHLESDTRGLRAYIVLPKA